MNRPIARIVESSIERQRILSGNGTTIRSSIGAAHRPLPDTLTRAGLRAAARTYRRPCARIPANPRSRIPATPLTIPAPPAHDTSSLTAHGYQQPPLKVMGSRWLTVTAAPAQGYPQTACRRYPRSTRPSLPGAPGTLRSAARLRSCGATGYAQPDAYRRRCAPLLSLAIRDAGSPPPSGS